MPLPISMRQLKEHYQQGRNIMSLLRDAQAASLNDTPAVLAAYDLQAGSYVEMMRDGEHNASTVAYAGAIARLLDRLGAATFLEAGVGEATTLAHVVQQTARRPSRAAGFDISWSRAAHGRAYAHAHDTDVAILVGDLFAIPVVDGAFDVVYTSHTIEPNRDREKAALAELYRVARRQVVLIEPAATFGNAATRERIVQHRYCEGLDRHARELGYNVVEHRLFDISMHDTTQSELIVIDKSPGAGPASPPERWLACPVCRTPLHAHRDHYFCTECCLIYPVVGAVPCLLPAAGILGSRFLDIS